MEGETLMPVVSMIIVEVSYAINNILSKLALDSGMNPLIHVAYRQIFGSALLVPFAYFMERNLRPRMTARIFLRISLCSILGISLMQITFVVGLKYSTPTIASSLFSISPAITFIIATLFRLERLKNLKSNAGLAKASGTFVCVGGALLLVLYHGPLLGVGPFLIHWRYAEKIESKNSSYEKDVNLLKGPLMLIISTTSFSLWLIFQTKVNRIYKAPFSSQALMSVMGSIQCTVAALCVSHGARDWSLVSNIRLASVLQSGTMAAALAYCLSSWCMNKKGPVYVAAFEPLVLVLVAVFSWGFLEEKWYLGKVLGSVLIVLGLYGVIWATKRETMTFNKEVLHGVEGTRHGNDV